MPIVSMPDGQLVDMPEKLSPDQAAKLKAMHPTAGPAAPAATAPPQKESTDVAPATDDPSTQTPGVTDLIGASFEPMLSMATSGVLQPISGIAGMDTGLLNSLGVTNADPAEVVKSIQGAAYEPHTAGGKNAMSVFNLPGEGIKALESDSTTPFRDPKERILGIHDSTRDSPAALTARDTILEGSAQLLGGKGGGAMKPRPSKIAAGVEDLGRRGVNMTPGQIRGGWLNDLEQKLSSVTFVGDFIKNARGKTTEQFQRATLDDGLKHIGAKLPDKVVGHDAVRAAREAFDTAYGELLPQLQGDLHTGGASSLMAKLTSLKNLAKKGLAPKDAAEIARVIDHEVIDKFTPPVREPPRGSPAVEWAMDPPPTAHPGGRIGGHTVKEVQQAIRTEIEDRLNSPDPQQRKLARAFMEVKAEIDKMLVRENPSLAARLKNVDTGYAKHIVAQAAASLKGAKGGVATPSQFKGAVRAQDRSKGKRRYAEGTALQQTLAETGEKVLGNTVPDSGTAGRAAAMGLLFEGGGAFAGHPALGALFIAAPLLYSQVGLKAMNPLLRGKIPMGPGIGRAAGVGANVNRVNEVDAAGVAQ